MWEKFYKFKICCWFINEAAGNLEREPITFLLQCTLTEDGPYYMFVKQHEKGNHNFVI